MSSQTTDTPGTTTTRNPAATRSGATSQTYPTPGHKANPQFSLRTTHPGTSPTQNSTPQRRTISRPFNKGFGRNLSASAAATQKTIHAPNTHRKSAFGRFRQPKFGVIAGIRGHNLPMQDVAGRKALLWSGSHRSSLQFAPRICPRLRMIVQVSTGQGVNSNRWWCHSEESWGAVGYEAKSSLTHDKPGGAGRSSNKSMKSRQQRTRSN